MLSCAGYEYCFSLNNREKQIRTAHRCAPKVAAGASAPTALRCPKKSSRCSLARFFRPLRVLRLAASATGGARLRTPYPSPAAGEGDSIYNLYIKMRRRHLESVSSRSLSVRGSWGTAPSAFWYGAPGGAQGPLGKGGAAERWRVTPSVGWVTRHGAQPATTRAYKSRPPPPGAHKPALNSHNKSQFLFPNKAHYLYNSRPISSQNVNFPLKKVKY